MVVGDYIKFKCNGKFILGEIVYITENIDEGKISVSVKTSNDLYMAIAEDDIYKTILDKDNYTLIKNKIENLDFYLYTSDEDQAFGIKISGDMYYVYNLSGNRFWNSNKVVETMTPRKFKAFKSNKGLYEISEINLQTDIFEFL